MELFDQQIADVRKFMTEKQQEGAAAYTIRCPGTAAAMLKDLPVDFNFKNQPFVVFKEDTFVELGSPLKGSCAMLLWTRQVEWIENGRITLMGPDIHESEGMSLPFAQVIMVAGDRLKAEDLVKLERAANLAHRLEGYMIRWMPGKIWSRISHRVAQKGFSFAALGAAMMAHLCMEVPDIDAIEILFVTTSKGDVQRLAQISHEAQDRRLSIRQRVRQKGGTYECHDLDCSACPDQEACQTIREVSVIRKDGKVARIEVVRGGEFSAAG